jgi:NaMN:DMB phosphoribosyltransferase
MTSATRSAGVAVLVRGLVAAAAVTVAVLALPGRVEAHPTLLFTTPGGGHRGSDLAAHGGAGNQ